MAKFNSEQFKDLFSKSIFSGIKTSQKTQTNSVKSDFLKTIQDRIKQIQDKKNKN